MSRPGNHFTSAMNVQDVLSWFTHLLFVRSYAVFTEEMDPFIMLY